MAGTGEVLKTNSGLATNDFYGKLAVYLKQLFSKFHDSLEAHPCTFSLLNVDAASLPHHLPNGTFARIEVSNIVDGAYLGIAKTLDLLRPLLQPLSVNPHAAMLTLFMNAIPEMASEKEHKEVAESELKRVMQYKPMLSPALMLGGNFAARVQTQMVTMMDASGLVRDVDKYMQEHRFDLFPAFLLMAMKESHTIIEKWPLRIKLLPGEEGAKEEFKTLLSSSHTGIERYVEWRRTT